MKKIGYFNCITFFIFGVGCSNNKKENGNLLDASSFPLILTTTIEKEEDLTKGSIFFNKDKTMTLEKEYLVNSNNEDTKKTKKVEFKKVDEGKRISDSEGNVYGDFGGK
ncbi:hypothetical protein HAX44_13305 [Enterococcus faecalis]|uniref:hypothetical protein n=1 Tax=Enterococcus faecalis TaxID=1351 RepID=UPI001883D198|nr:hypothetical protein [Enterococcus faecalis]MBF0006587.1 hypothetical protein [Enterococcus faecalis]MBF0009270.1 hypothetical protein [Enterococcus faecalis]MBF0018451.1 hypothetical protein [Enterococcus faecalis]